jgi:hypothetical protein
MRFSNCLLLNSFLTAYCFCSCLPISRDQFLLFTFQPKINRASNLFRHCRTRLAAQNLQPFHLVGGQIYVGAYSLHESILRHFDVCCQLVAEKITARFFNVIRLLNRAVPIIAIQLSAFPLGDEVVLQFVPVLDTNEFGGEPEEEEGGEPTDRAYWEKKAKPESLAVVEAIKDLVAGQPKITYNKYHIALATTGYNMCWFHPRKANCQIDINIGPDKRQAVVDRLAGIGIGATIQRWGAIGLHLRTKDIQEHRQIIAEIIRDAEEYSHR